MPVTVRLHPWLHRAAGGRPTVHIPAGTLGECLEEIAVRHPVTRGMLFDERGVLKSYIVVLRNGEALEPDGAEPVADGDELAFLFLMDGG